MLLKKKKFFLLCLFLISIFLFTEIFGSRSNNLILPEKFSQINKIGDDLRSLLSQENNIQSNPIRIIIVFKNNLVMNSGIQKITALSEKIQYNREWSFIPAAIFSSPIEYIADIAQFSEVQRIWLDHEFSIAKFGGKIPDSAQNVDLNNPSLNNPIFTKNSNNYTEMYNGTNVIVALLDTGIDISHPDLKNNSILAFGGVSLVEGEPFPFVDFHGHGTFCAGLITGDGVQSPKYKGVAPGTSILNIKVLSSLGMGLWSWIISGIEYAIVHGADIIALCFSMPGYPGDPVNLAIDAAIKRGMIVVAAVGDDGPAYSSVTAPGMAQNAITVGAFNDFTQQVAYFSGRGPTLSFHSKPDILASGVNITSCRPLNNLTELLQGQFSIDLTDFFLEPSYGLNISEYYTVVNSTAAAAANVTGFVASLLHHSKFLTVEEVKIILQQTATSLSGVDPNVQGAGLINITKAHAYIVHNNLNNSLVEKRLYTPSLFSSGYVASHNTTRNSTLFITSYGSLFLLIDSYQNNISTHLIQGQFAIKYNNQIKYLSEMSILRELHNLTTNFSIMQSVISDYPIIFVFTIEGFSMTSGFRVNLTIINLGSSPLQNITIFSNWNTDLYWEPTIATRNDIGAYNITDDIIYVYDSINNNSPCIGFTGIKPSSAHEINTGTEVRSQIGNGRLENNSFFADENASIAMEWNVISELNNSQYTRFSQIISIADSYNALNNSIETIKNLQSNENITNLALLSSNLSRIGSIGQPYTSNVLAMNLGNVAVNDTFTAFIINSTEDQTQTLYSKYINLGQLKPFEFRWINVTWNPIDVDIYSAYWIIGTESQIYEIILYLMNISQKISGDQNFLDNFFVRNIFIKNNLFKICSLFPNNIPIAPQLVYFPNDIAIFNISITTNHPLTNLQVFPLEGNLPSDWISFNFPSNLQDHGSIQIILNITYNPKAGLFYRRFNITSANYHIGEIWVNFSIQYPSGRILFYKPTFNFSIQGNFEISNLLTIWNERLDTIYGGYFELFNLCLQNNYEVDDFGLLKQFSSNISLNTNIPIPFELPYETSTIQKNSSFLSYYDLVILCDPEVNLTADEIDTLIEFGQNGGNLFFWMEPDTESEQFSINSILNPFNIQIDKSYYNTTTQNFSLSSQHEMTLNLNEIQLHSFITFQNSSPLSVFTEYSNEPTLLLNDSFGKVLCIGDSSLFNDTFITEVDNLPFLNNSIHWLLKEKINISLFINPNNASEPLRIDQYLSILVQLTSINGTGLTENITLFTYLITPSNRILYMIFFHVQDGWFNTIYLDKWLNETGTYFLVIYANSPSQISSYITLELILEGARPDPDEPPVGRNWATDSQILIGIIIAVIITNILMGIFFYQRRQWHRKMTIVELKEKMQREISNLMSEYHLYLKELEELLNKPKIRDPDKLRMILDMQERKKELLDRLKKLGKKL